MDYFWESSSDPKPITLHLLKAMTKNFSERMEIGRGAYGVVYKGELDEEEMAVKKLISVHGVTDKTFDSECRNLKKVRHKNVVRMTGYCYEIAHRDVKHEGQYVWSQVIDRALCFEYMKGGSLSHHISAESCKHDWPTTYKIINGTCEGLHHLHHGGEMKILHLDLKPDNVLLDEKLVPKIGDFGLSRLFGSSYTHKISTMIGTRGFMPPEYIQNCTVSPKTDVFSLGVIIFYMMAGARVYGDYWDARRRPNFSPKIQQKFIKRVQGYWKTKMQAFEGYRWDKADLLGVTKCIEMAMSCVEDDRHKRPHIKKIMNDLKKLDSQIEEMLKDDPKPLIHQLRRTNHVNELEAVNQHRTPTELGKYIAADPSLELRFPFELKKEIRCILQLSNRAATSFIAFNVNTGANKYRAWPNTGILEPGSKCYVTITLLAQKQAPQNMECVDKLVVQGIRVSEHFTPDEITQDFFVGASAVDEVTLPIVYIPLPLSQ